MTQAQLTQALSGISVTNVFAFFLVLARISPLFLLSPGFSSQMLIPRVRSVLAVGLAIGITPLAEHNQTIPTDVMALVGLMFENFLVGLALAYTISCVFGAVQGAGVFADAFGGFSFGSMIDPINGNPGGSMTNLYSVVGLAMFFAIGGDAWTLRGLSATFSAVPIADTAQVRPLVYSAEAAFSALLVGAIEIAAPVILAIIVTDIAFGMVSKVVPQLNVFAVGFTVKVGVTLLIVSASLPFVGTWMTNQLETSLATALHSLKVA
ncbi:MAG TPA: flagellar biosynthetic protein FliR [Solirubrobacteraceae bacterium]|jgi:flagellar biosynthetic protein FliR|nr:flagellar biosynthetic protein FliR [Solirubrobacteraceae bacterium]